MTREPTLRMLNPRLSRVPTVHVIAIAVLFCFVCCLTGCAGTTSGQGTLPSITPWQQEAVRLPEVPVATTEPDADGVEFTGVSISGEEAYIVVQFKASPKTVQGWTQGTVYVVDEKTSAIYKDVPVAPIIGPLLGRPVEEGQLGYVMLFNQQDGIKPGSVVSVILGKYKRVHVTVPPV